MFEGRENCCNDDRAFFVSRRFGTEAGNKESNRFVIS